MGNVSIPNLIPIISRIKRGIVLQAYVLVRIIFPNKIINYIQTIQMVCKPIISLIHVRTLLLSITIVIIKKIILV